MARVDILSKYDIGDPATASRAELEKAVRGMGKAANQRLRSNPTSPASKAATSRLHALGRNRFLERTSKQSTKALAAEYKRQRDYLARPTSTKSGAKKSARKRYKTAVKAGYTGTYDEFVRDVETAFKSSAGDWWSSDVTYQMLVAGKTQRIVELAKDERARAETTPGKELLQAIRVNTLIQQLRKLYPELSPAELKAKAEAYAAAMKK